MYYSSDGKKKFVYLYRSSFYDESNATIDLAGVINDADIAIDGKRKENKLRDKVEELLNDAAQGELTPQVAAVIFTELLLQEIQKALKKTDGPKNDVLKLYYEKAQLLWSFIDLPESIDRLLNINLADSYSTASSIDVEQSKSNYVKLVQKKIEEFLILILQERHEKENEPLPYNFHRLYKLRILQQFEGENLKIVEAALGINASDLAEKVKTLKKTKGVSAIFDKHDEKIKRLANDIIAILSKSKEESASEVQPISSEKQKQVRSIIYPLQFQIIRETQEVESKIKSKIESVWNKINSKSGKTPYLKTFFHYTLLSNKTFGIRFSKLLNISLGNLEQKIRDIKVNQRAVKPLEEHASLINSLSLDILKASLNSSLGKDQKKKLKDKIDQLLVKITSSSTAKACDNQSLFYRRLYDGLATDASKETQAAKDAVKAQKLLNELIDTNITELDEQIEKSSKETSAEKKLLEKDTKKQIQEIFDTTEKALKELEEKTETYRGSLLKELRELHEMGREDLKEVYKHRYPESPLENEAIQKLESADKDIFFDETMRYRVAEIFGINVSLFEPSHFAG